MSGSCCGEDQAFVGKAKGKSVGKVVHYIKMLVINDLSANTIDGIVRKHVAKDTVVVTDNSSSHNNLPIISLSISSSRKMETLIKWLNPSCLGFIL